MGIEFTVTQKQRLIELNAGEEVTGLTFADPNAREAYFASLQKEMLEKNKKRLEELFGTGRPNTRLLESKLVGKLNGLGFAEVITPIMMARGALRRMNLSEEHHLWDQIYWLEDGRALRPMLAPNLYFLLRNLQRLWSKSVRIFEIGPCFRKESKGSCHLSEFTMLNLVELGPTEPPGERLRAIIKDLFADLDIDYQIVPKSDSEVYGVTLDVEAAGLELASGATGSHVLDANWGITEPWAGLGLGLERLCMVSQGFRQIRRVGRSLMYQNGARLNA